MSSTIVAKAVPSGGLVTLTIKSDSPMTLSRAVSGVGGLGAYTQLYSGGTQPFYIDAGDQLPGPLQGGLLYVYQLVDDTGTYVTPPVAPTQDLAVQVEPLTLLLQRTIQGAINNLVLPAGIQKTTVLQAMPLGGIPPLPFITINLNSVQQREIPIGQSAWMPDPFGSITITGLADRIYQISILSLNSPERDFYRDAMIGIFQSFIGSILAPVGRDVTHSFQIASGQVAKDTEGMSPGFYYADCMLQFSGSFDVTILTDYGLIERIDFTAYASDGTVTFVTVPLA